MVPEPKARGREFHRAASNAGGIGGKCAREDKRRRLPGLVAVAFQLVEVVPQEVELLLALRRDPDQLVPVRRRVDDEEAEAGAHPDHGANRFVDGDEESVQTCEGAHRNKVGVDNPANLGEDAELLPVGDEVGLLDRVFDESEELDAMRCVGCLTHFFGFTTQPASARASKCVWVSLRHFRKLSDMILKSSM